jgi:hypothetical protein
MTDVEDRVRARAYRLWQEEGCPLGRELAHWEKAKELVAIEDNQLATTKPIGNALPYGEPVEPLEALTNVGEFPTLTDQSEGKAPQSPHSREPSDPGN